MPGRLDKLLQVAGPALSARRPGLTREIMAANPKLSAELLDLLSRRNGFFAFESALHVFGADPSLGEADLLEWNSPHLWRDRYGQGVDGMLFFAQDIFGMQFTAFEDQIWVFDPETGDLEHFAGDLESWAAEVLDDLELHTGQPLAHAWQVKNGALPLGKRLAPKVPFVAGGEFEISNLTAQDATTAMRARAEIAKQLADLPDGASVRFSVTD